MIVGHLLDPLIARSILRSGPFGQCIHVFFLGVERHLNLIDDLLEILMEFGVQNDADVFEGKALVDGSFADPNPGDIALADMHNSLDIVD